MLPHIDFFLDFHDDRATHKDKFMFWDQSQHRLCKIIKNSRERHKDQC
jgi:hypothetical protein